MKLHFPVSRPFRIISDHTETENATNEIFSKIEGVDIESSANENVYSVCYGIVRRAVFIDSTPSVESNKDLGSCDRSISIEHHDKKGNIFRSIYSNLSGIYVAEGEKVLKGQLIGEYENKRDAEKPYLHLSIVDNEGTPIDPLRFNFG